MKLFIWNDPYPVKYGGSFLYAVAETVEQAKEIVVTAKIYHFGAYDREGNIIGPIKLGEPTRILDLPCAEAYQWEE